MSNAEQSLHALEKLGLDVSIEDTPENRNKASPLGEGFSTDKTKENKL